MFFQCYDIKLLQKRRHDLKLTVKVVVRLIELLREAFKSNKR